MKTQVNKIRLYGRQKFKPLSVLQKELFDNLLPNIDLDIQELENTPSAVLEIGFGSGDHLIHLAQKNSQTLYVGFEPFLNGVANLLVKLDENNLQNVRIHNGDVRLMYAELPKNIFDEIYLLFPDPWPKKRHWKRRFIQKQTFSQIHQLLKPGGKWFIATDHPSYQLWVDEMFQTQECSSLFSLLNHNTPDQEWDDFKPTRYHQKAVKEGRQTRYYVLEPKVIETSLHHAA